MVFRDIMRSVFVVSLAVTLIAVTPAPGLAQNNEYVVSSPGPGLFVDTLWGFAIPIPDKYVAKYHHRDSLTSQNYGFLGPQTGPSVSVFLAYRWSRVIQNLETDRHPRFTSDPDTVKQMALFFFDRTASFPFAGANVTERVDSIVERKTLSGLRMFIQHITQIVDYGDPEAADSSALPPSYYVAVPDGNDWTFVMIEGWSGPEPPPAKLEELAAIARSVQAWHR